MLKADLHVHTREDPQDIIKYDAKALIERACSLRFEVISITNHDKVRYDEKLADYAKRKGILLIPGAEVTIKGKHVLVYNITNKELATIKSFNDLRRFKKKGCLIVAPHPFFLKKFCLANKLIDNLELFDAIEYTASYTKHININKKAVMVSKEYSVPLVGASDAHSLKQFGSTYSLIDADKNIDSVFNAIRNNKVKVVTKPVSFGRLGINLSKMIILRNARRIHRKILI